MELNNNQALHHYNLGVKLHKLGKLDEAEASYKKAIELKPNYFQAHNNLGSTLQKIGKLDESEASYKKAIKFSPEKSEHWYNKAETLADLEKYDDAITAYRKSIRYSEGEDSEAIMESWYGIAWVSGLQKNYKGALVAIDAALDIDKGDYDHWHLKSILLLQKKKYINAQYHPHQGSQVLTRQRPHFLKNYK